MMDLQRLQFAIIQHEIGVHLEAELNFEIVERLLVTAHGVDPRAFGGQLLLFLAAEIRAGHPAFLREGAGAIRVLARTLQVEIAVAHGVAIAQHVVVGGSDPDAEIFAELGEVPQAIEQIAFGLRQILHFLLEPGVAPQRTDERGAQLRRSGQSRIAGDEAQKIRRERRRDPPHVADQPAFAHRTVGTDTAILDKMVAQRSAFRGRDVVSRVATCGKKRRELMAGKRE